jgi:hypothetical protein
MVRIRVGSSSLALVLCLSSAALCSAHDIAPRLHRARRAARPGAAMNDLRDAPASPARAERAAWAQPLPRDRGERPAPVPRLRAPRHHSAVLMSVTPRRADPPPWSNPGAVSL